MAITCSRKIHFCAGHRVMNHESKCANLHGHNYIAWIYAEAPELDAIGRVIDFSVLKERVGGWIDENWDHTTLIFERDQKLIEVLQQFEQPKPIFLCNFNPTAENMANYLMREVCPALLAETGVKVTRVVLYETENCFADLTF